MLEKVLQYKKYILIIVGIFLIAFYYLFFNNDEDLEQFLEEDDFLLEVTDENKAGAEEEPKKIMVDIKGEINKPGVYIGLEGERIVDLVERAGGLTKDAAEELVNFALYIEDEMVIHIPKRGEEGSDIVVQSDLMSAGLTSSASNNSKININKATESELQSLTGIGPSKAVAIIDYRETNGPFKSAEDIMLVSGIGEKTFEKIADQISVK